MPNAIAMRVRMIRAMLDTGKVAWRGSASGYAAPAGATFVWMRCSSGGPNIRGFYDAALADLSIEETYLLMRLLDRLTAGLAKL